MSAHDDICDVYDKTQWQEVSLEAGNGTNICAGAPKTPGVLRIHLVCPLSDNPTEDELEEQCCSNCTVSRRLCAGFSIKGPVPLRGAKIAWQD
jgi:hypothetical protein